MYKKIVLLLALTTIARAQDAPEGVTATGGELVETTRGEDNQVLKRRYKVAERLPVTQTEILDQLECFEDRIEKNCYFSKFDAEDLNRWESEVINQLSELEVGKPNEVYFKKMRNGKFRFQFIFWQDETNIYATLSKRRRPRPNEGSNISNRPVFEEVLKFYRPMVDGSCFRIIPKGCKYSGQSSEYFQELCQGYDKVAEKVKEDIIKVSALIQNDDTIRVSNGEKVATEYNNGFNPAWMANDFAKCLSRTIRNNSIQLDCAIKGIPMDHRWAEERLNALRDELVADGMTNVTIDYDTLSINYDDELESRGVEKTVGISESDFIV